MKTFFCTYFSSESVEHDLLGYVCGDLVCDICVWNGMTECPHVAVDDHPELKRKGVPLLEDYKRHSVNNNATVCEMLPDGPVDCFVGYTDKLEKGWTRYHFAIRCLRIDLYEYSGHIFYTEESEAVVQ